MERIDPELIAERIAARWATNTGADALDDHVDAGGFDHPWPADPDVDERLALLESDGAIGRAVVIATDRLRDRFPTAWADELNRAIDDQLGIAGPFEDVVGF